MKGIVYYNTKGKIFTIEWGEDLVPDKSMAFMEIDVPAGAVIQEVDLSKTPPKLVFTTYPENDYIELEKRVKQTEEQQVTTNESISSHATKISTAEEDITNLELALVSIYEGGM